MSQPPQYTPSTAFLSFEGADPLLPGTELDVEFVNIQESIDAILANLELIQRDDGQLRNESVGYDQLDPALLTNGIYPLTEWVTATRYNKYQCVTHDAGIYRCEVAHTSGTFATDLADEKWTQIVDLAIDTPDLAAIEALAGTGLLRRTGSNTWTLGTTVSIAEGGTGEDTAAEAFAALKQDATEVDTGVVRIATVVEAAAAVADDAVLTPEGGLALVLATVATETDLGVVELADQNEAEELGTTPADDKVMTPETTRLLLLALGIATPEMYGAVGDGSTDDKAAFDALKAAGHTHWRGKPGAIYRHVGQFVPPSSTLDFNLNGATFKPIYTGGFYAITNTAPTRASYNSAGGMTTVPAKEIEVDSTPSDLAVGDEVFHTTGFNSAQFRRITDITGTTITYDRDINTPLIAGVEVNKAVFLGTFAMYGGIIDCSGIVNATTGVMFLDGYERVTIKDIIWRNIDLDTSNTTHVMAIWKSRTVRIRDNDFPNSFAGGQLGSCFWCESVLISGNTNDGEGFGWATSSSDNVIINGNVLQGNFNTSGQTGKSIRGIKPTFSFSAVVTDNILRDYDSGVKLEDVSGVVASGNVLERCRTGVVGSPGTELEFAL